MEEIEPIWCIVAEDHVRLDGKEFEVLDKNLVPPRQRGWVLPLHQGGELDRALLATLSLERRSHSHLLI